MLEAPVDDDDEPPIGFDTVPLGIRKCLPPIPLSTKEL
eukprot:gene21831-30380_t